MARDTVADGNDCAPFGKPGAHANVFSKAVAQSIQAFGHLFTGMSCQLLGARVHFDSRNDSRLDENFDKWSAVALLLADCLVEEDRATDALTEPRGCDNQFAIGAPSFDGLGNPQTGKALVTGGKALIHCQQALVACDKGLRGISKRLRFHLGLLRFVLRLSKT